MEDFGTKIRIITRFPSIKAQARTGYKERKHQLLKEIHPRQRKN
jgi:hypothetical protein